MYIYIIIISISIILSIYALSKSLLYPIPILKKNN